MTLRAALGFFTRLPIGSAPLPPTFRGVAVWLPMVGLIIGLLVSLALGLAAQILPASLCGVIGCLAWVAVTGGLHLDGVADCGDGLIVEAPPARRLEIMKDSRLGTFGGAALFFILAQGRGPRRAGGHVSGGRKRAGRLRAPPAVLLPCRDAGAVHGFRGDARPLGASGRARRSPARRRGPAP